MISLKKRNESKEEAEFKSSFSLMEDFSIIHKEPTKSKDKSKAFRTKSK